MLTGGILGARNGLLVAVTVFLLSATVGSPLLAGCRGGVALWTGPSTGHLIGWLVGVVVIDLLTARALWLSTRCGKPSSSPCFGGAFVVYVFGATSLGIGPASIQPGQAS
jgi:biotin transport system substrate-specific component